jgi:phage RecT family recombinase
MNAIQTTKTPREYIMSLRGLFDDFNKRQGGRLVFNEEVGHFMSQLESMVERGQLQCIDDVFLHTAFIGGVQLGLSFAKRQGHAFVIPGFHQNLRQNVPSFFLGYKGMQHLVSKSTMVMTMAAEVVFTNDEFTYHGLMDKPLHRHNANNDRGFVQGAYTISLLTNGGVLTTYMPAEELSVIEDNAKLNANDAWSGPFVNELRKKTAIRRHFKSLLPVLNLDIDESAIETEQYDANFN